MWDYLAGSKRGSNGAVRSWDHVLGSCCGIVASKGGSNAVMGSKYIRDRAGSNYNAKNVFYLDLVLLNASSRLDKFTSDVFQTWHCFSLSHFF